jgi:DNA-binding NtrC family response regulator
MKQRILLVDDDSYTRELFKGLLRKNSVELQTAANAAEARRAFRSVDFNLVILDQRLPDGNGLDLFAEMRSERPRLMAILITGFAEIRDAIRAVREGLFDYLTKPFENLDQLDAVISKALEVDQAYREIVSLREMLEARPGHPAIISRSMAMERLLVHVRQLAPLDTTVLLEGESGTGKEMIANQIHAYSNRAKGPFLGINCGALSESLLEATLFGYEKGAFTGAAKATAGYFEDVNGGTLLLDEITDMSPKLQASLLRVLDEHKFTRLGSTVARPSDFRLICATNKSIEAEMKEGRFRADLYYRINVVPIRVLPLRERPDDIVVLALHFLDHFNRKFGKTAGPFTPEAITALEQAEWAGNVRELRHTVERAVAVNEGRPIIPTDFGPFSHIGQSMRAPGSAQPLPLREAREHFEREYFADLLRASQGNVSEAARLSGIARQNLYTYIDRFGLATKS